SGAGDVRGRCSRLRSPRCRGLHQAERAALADARATAAEAEARLNSFEKYRELANDPIRGEAVLDVSFRHVPARLLIKQQKGAGGKSQCFSIGLQERNSEYAIQLAR